MRFRSTMRPRAMSGTPGLLRRRGMTLVELTFAMALVTLLVTFLLTAIVSVWRTWDRTAEVAMLGKLSTALRWFHDKYKFYPPSRIYLIENGDYTDAGNAALDLALLKESHSTLASVFPGIKLARTATANSGVQGHDWDGSGQPARDSRNTGSLKFLLEGDQCLVFFLFGVPNRRLVEGGSFVDRVGQGVYIKGFANNDIPGISTDAVSSYSAIEWKPGLLKPEEVPGRLYWKRVRDATAPTTFLSNSFFPVLVDKRALAANPDALSGLQLDPNSESSISIAYFSSYNAAGYRPDDLMNSNEGKVDFRDIASVDANYNKTKNEATADDVPGPNPYFSPTTNDWFNPESFQLIMPGPDGKFGPGRDPRNAANGTDKAGADNLVNFSENDLGKSSF